MVSLNGGILIDAGSIHSNDEVDQFTFKFQREQLIFNEIEKRQNKIYSIETQFDTMQENKLKHDKEMFDKYASEKDFNPIGYMLAKMALKQDDCMDELI